MSVLHITTGELVAAHAHAFAATLTKDQRQHLFRKRTPQTMADWSNFPQQVLGKRNRRGGLSTGDLSAAQWTALFALLDAAMGSGGERVRGHLAADDHLLSLGGRHGYGRGEFVVAFLGVPAAHGTWQLQFGGHHLAVTHTYRDGELAGATPSFRGIEPYTAFRQAGRLYEPERASRVALSDLLATLDDDQRDRARVRSRDDLHLGPGADWRFPSFRKGLPATALGARQRALLQAAIATYVDDAGPRDAGRIMARYVAELDETYLGWSGSPKLSSVGDYVRITGPSVWIELSLQDGIVSGEPHPHGVWRDRVSDYGGTPF